MGLEYIAESGKSDNLIAGEDLQSYVPEPVTGWTPLSFFTAPRYTGTVVWRNGAFPLTGRAFGSGTSYTAEVMLRAAAGYSFSGIPAAPGAGSFTHSQSTELSHEEGAGGELVIIITFEATGAGPMGTAPSP
jgi:hypothetical protein